MYLHRPLKKRLQLSLDRVKVVVQVGHLPVTIALGLSPPSMHVNGIAHHSLHILIELFTTTHASRARTKAEVA